MANFFTYEDRLTLQHLLKEGLSFKKIAAHLHKDPSTISRESQEVCGRDCHRKARLPVQRLQEPDEL